MLDDAAAKALTARGTLEVLAITNAGLTDDGVKAVVAQCPRLVELDLSSNTNLTGASLRAIADLGHLERLTLVQTRLNDLATRRLARLEGLRALDLRGNMEAGDLTLEVAGGLPKLAAFKHRSTVVTDAGVAGLAASTTLRSLLLQDFAITDASGAHLARLAGLESLEIFRCQGFGTDGVLALAGLPLTRLTLRDLPDVRDPALEVLRDLPKLQRLYLHELPSVGDDGLARLASATSLRVLDIWSVPAMTDATVEAIAMLPALEELSIRETGVGEAALARILAMPKLTSLTFKDNGTLSRETVAALAGKRWKKLDLGADTPAASR
jgi:Leucine-rich repeat (LRR) protein